MEEARKGKIKKVMVPIDESESSYYAFMWTLNNLEESIKNSSLVIFAAQPPPPHCYFVSRAPLGSASLYFPGVAGPGLAGSALERSKRICSGLLKKANEICANRGVKAETITGAGDPKVAICNAVQSHNIDLLILGHESDGSLQRFFKGTLSGYCLNNTKCPVLVVKRPE